MPVHLEFDTPRLAFHDGGSRVVGNRARLGVRHQAAGTQHSPKLPDFLHRIGSSNRYIKLNPSGLNFFQHVLVPDMLRARFTGGIRGLALCKYQNRHQLPGSVR